MPSPMDDFYRSLFQRFIISSRTSTTPTEIDTDKVAMLLYVTANPMTEDLKEAVSPIISSIEMPSEDDETFAAQIDQLRNVLITKNSPPFSELAKLLIKAPNAKIRHQIMNQITAIYNPQQALWLLLSLLELEYQEQATTFMRTDTMTTLLSNKMSLALGQPYAQEVLYPYVQEVLELCPSENFSNFTPQDGDSDDFLQKLHRIHGRFLSTFLNTKLPYFTRIVCNNIAYMYDDAAINTKFSLIGGFIVLRFLGALLADMLSHDEIFESFQLDTSQESTTAIRSFIHSIFATPFFHYFGYQSSGNKKQFTDTWHGKIQQTLLSTILTKSREMTDALTQATLYDQHEFYQLDDTTPLCGDENRLNEIIQRHDIYQQKQLSPLEITLMQDMHARTTIAREKPAAPSILEFIMKRVKGHEFNVAKALLDNMSERERALIDWTSHEGFEQNLLEITLQHAAMPILELVLQQYKQDIYQIDPQGWTLLNRFLRYASNEVISAPENYLAVLDYLLSNNANLTLVTADGPHFGKNALHFAVQSNNIALVDRILSHLKSMPKLHRLEFINQQAQGCQANTPLHLAAINNNEKIYQHLIKVGANPALENADGDLAVALKQPQLKASPIRFANQLLGFLQTEKPIRPAQPEKNSAKISCNIQ